MATSEYQKLLKLQDRVSTAYRVSLIDALHEFERVPVLTKIESAIKSGKINDDLLDEMVKERKMASLFDHVDTEFQIVFEEAGVISQGYIPTVGNKPFFFTPKNPVIKQIFTDHIAQRVTDLGSSMKKVLSSQIEDAYRYGKPARKTAKEIAKKVGMNANQTRAYENLKKRLEENGTSPKVIEKRLESYKKKAIKERAEMIATTELSEATNLAQAESWRQAEEQDLMPKGAKKKWLAILDEKTSDICKDLDKRPAIPWKDNFIDINGVEHYSPPGHIRCRSGMKLVL